MDNGFKFVTTGYLYSPWAGKLREMKGEVYHRDEIRHSSVWEITPERTYFNVTDEYGKVIKTINCSVNEGELHNKVIWLREPNMRRAADILIEYEETQIAKLRFKIENHEQLIETLRSV